MKALCIIVDHNTPVLALEAARSVKSQQGLEGVDIECLIVNNGRPYTREELEKLSDLEIKYEECENHGFAAACNIGIGYEKSDWYWLLNPDAIASPYALCEMLKTASKNLNSLIGGHVQVLNSDIIDFGSIYSPFALSRTKKRIVLFDEDIEVYSPPGACMLLPAIIIETVGLLCEDFFLYCEEIDYAARARKYGFRSVLSAKAHVSHVHSASVGNDNPIKWYYQTLNYLRLSLRHGGLTAQVYAVLRTLAFSILDSRLQGYRLKLIVDSCKVLWRDPR